MTYWQSQNLPKSVLFLPTIFERPTTTREQNYNTSTTSQFLRNSMRSNVLRSKLKNSLFRDCTVKVTAHCSRLKCHSVTLNTSW